MKHIDWILPFTQVGSRNPMMIKIFILGKNYKYDDIDFSFDTGNGKTCVSKKVLCDLGYENDVYDAIQTITSRSTMADGSEYNNSEIVVSNIQIGNLYFDEFTFEIAADSDKDFSNLLGLDVIENFNPQMDFDIYEIRGKLRPICELNHFIEHEKNVKLESLEDDEFSELSNFT